MRQSITCVASLLTLASTALAAGSARVVNNCGSGTEVFFASVAQNAPAPMEQLPASGYSEAYDKPNVGVSIKMSTSAGGPVTQFEFTWASGSIFYDISNINGNPFAQQGMSLVPSMAGASGYPTCVAVDCPAGQSTCNAAYNNPDDTRTTVCPEDSDLVFTLCPGGASSSPQSSPQGSPQPGIPSSASPSQPAASSSPYQAPHPATSSSPVIAPQPATTDAPVAPAPTVTQAPTQQPAYTTGQWGGHHHWTRRHGHRFNRYRR